MAEHTSRVYVTLVLGQDVTYAINVYEGRGVLTMNGDEVSLNVQALSSGPLRGLAAELLAMADLIDSSPQEHS
jgi:hypothetical protein